MKYYSCTVRRKCFVWDSKTKEDQDNELIRDNSMRILRMARKYNWTVARDDGYVGDYGPYLTGKHIVWLEKIAKGSNYEAKGSNYEAKGKENCLVIDCKKRYQI